MNDLIFPIIGLINSSILIDEMNKPELKKLLLEASEEELKWIHDQLLREDQLLLRTIKEKLQKEIETNPNSHFLADLKEAAKASRRKLWETKESSSKRKDTEELEKLIK